LELFITSLPSKKRIDIPWNNWNHQTNFDLTSKNWELLSKIGIWWNFIDRNRATYNILQWYDSDLIQVIYQSKERNNSDITKIPSAKMVLIILGEHFVCYRLDGWCVMNASPSMLHALWTL
jgi:hypothetical protein